MIKLADQGSLQNILKHDARPPCQTAPMNSQIPDHFVTVSPEILYFGTPVAVISTLNPDGTTNLAAMSSFWALGDRFMLGLTSYGQTGPNLARTSECVLNLPSPAEWKQVERLAHTTGRFPLTDYHRSVGIVHAKDKFGASGFSPLASQIVLPLRAAECPVQIEARVRGQNTHPMVRVVSSTLKCRDCAYTPLAQSWTRRALGSTSIPGRHFSTSSVIISARESGSEKAFAHDIEPRAV